MYAPLLCAVLFCCSWRWVEDSYKSLKNYENAIKCCENHLRITRELRDKLGEGRACYNLGNVHHAVGKADMAKKKVDPDAKARGTAAIKKAIVYYRETLIITGCAAIFPQPTLCSALFLNDPPWIVRMLSGTLAVSVGWCH